MFLLIVLIDQFLFLDYPLPLIIIWTLLRYYTKTIPNYVNPWFLFINNCKIVSFKVIDNTLYWNTPFF